MDKTDPLHSRGKWVRPPSSAALALLIDSRARDSSPHSGAAPCSCMRGGVRLSPYSGSSVCDIRKGGRVPNIKGKGLGPAQDTESNPVLYASAEDGGQCMHISERYLRYLRTGRMQGTMCEECRLGDRM